MREKTVLVVEDDPILSDLTKEILVAEGFTVVQAATRAELTAALDTVGPHWAIVDFQLEGWDGLSAIQAVRASRHGVAKVVALSGWPWSDERLTGFINAADYCLQKPVDWNELLSIVRDEATPSVGAV